MAEKKSTKDMTADEFADFVAAWTDAAEAAMEAHVAQIQRAERPASGRSAVGVWRTPGCGGFGGRLRGLFASDGPFAFPQDLGGACEAHGVS